LAAPEFAPLVINLRRNVVERLSRDVWHTLDSILSQGMEIGGLLLGTRARETRVIKIEDFAPLAWNSRTQRFVPSESECRALHSTLATCAWLRDRQFHVVGCYRSHVGEGFSLSANDLALAQSCCQGPSSLFLQIKPSSGGTLSAAFFSWGNGQNDCEYVFKVFPFDVRRLADEPDETCEPRVSDGVKTKPPFGMSVEQSFPVAFSETTTKPTENVAVRIPACRHQRRVRRARTRAPRAVRRFLQRTRAFPWRTRTLQVLGYPFAVARAASRRVRTRVGQAGALVHRAFLAPVQTLFQRTRAFPWRTRALQVLGYPLAVARAASRRVRTRAGQAGALVHRAFLAPVQTLFQRTRAFPWRARALQVLGYPLAVPRAAIRRVRTRVAQAGALVHRVFLAPVQTCLQRMRVFPWRARTLPVPWYLSAALIIVMELAGYRVYLSQGGSPGSTNDEMISGRPSNLRRSRFEVVATPVTRTAQTSAAPSRVSSSRNAAPPNRVAATGNRARRKPRTSSGKEPPFTCAPRDVFYKTDAAPGWNTFTCLSKNVWSIRTALPVK
jgi:hypothetical protein